MKKPRNTVLMFYSPRNTNSAAVLSGVANYARQRKWRLIIVNPSNAKSLRQLIRIVRPVGCIVDAGSGSASDRPQLLPAAFGSTPVAYFSIDPSVFPKTCSHVNLDSAEVGRLAAKELLALPVASFGYVPWPRKAHWCDERRVAFAEAVSGDGRPVSCFETSATDELVRQRDFADWLRARPKPVALFAANDAVAWNIAQIVDDLGLRIPDDIALLGVDNVEAICANSIPRLSSIALDFTHDGRLVAQLLDDLIHGRVKKPTSLRFHPSTVVHRESTVVRTSAKRAVRRAVALIEEKFAEGLRARDVIAVLGGSRRTAERLFREATGKSILDAINDQRFERAKALLRNRTTDISAIADACGWTSSGYLRRIFRQRTGLSMSAWRDQNPAQTP